MILIQKLSNILIKVRIFTLTFYIEVWEIFRMGLMVNAISSWTIMIMIRLHTIENNSISHLPFLKWGFMNRTAMYKKAEN